MTTYAIKKPSAAKEVFKVLKLFWGAQLFFVIMILSFNYGGPIVFGVIAAIPPIVAWSTGGKKSYRFILYFLCMAFVIGQRTMYIGTAVRIVPSAAILWVLAITCLLIKPQYKVGRKSIPGSAIILCLASLWGVLLGYENRGIINQGFAYSHMMFMSIPAFFVAYRLVQRTEHLRMITNILALGCIFLSFLGISEYFGLGFVHFFSGYLKDDTGSGSGGFTRMAATFWGGPMIVGYLAICFPITMADFATSKTGIQRGIFLLSLGLSFIAIYLSGYRGVWMPVLISIGIYFYFRGVRGIIILILLISVGFYFIPQNAKVRFSKLGGKARDSSSAKREGRARDTWHLIVKKPIMGHGWAASGLVHSDYLQIWADTGFFGFFGLIGCIFVVLRRLFYITRIRDKILREYARGFFSSIVSAGLILAGETWFNLPENYTPFWVIMGLAYQLTNVVSIEKMVKTLAVEEAKLPNRDALSSDGGLALPPPAPPLT